MPDRSLNDIAGGIVTYRSLTAAQLLQLSADDRVNSMENSTPLHPEQPAMGVSN